MVINIFIFPITPNLLLQMQSYFLARTLLSNIIHCGINMNYRHAYHAGNFADVVKHVILTALVSHLERKENPYCYIDTHAGSGFYNLFSDATQKTKEYEN